VLLHRVGVDPHTAPAQVADQRLPSPALAKVAGACSRERNREERIGQTRAVDNGPLEGAGQDLSQVGTQPCDSPGVAPLHPAASRARSKVPLVARHVGRVDRPVLSRSGSRRQRFPHRRPDARQTGTRHAPGVRPKGRAGLPRAGGDAYEPRRSSGSENTKRSGDGRSARQGISSARPSSPSVPTSAAKASRKPCVPRKSASENGDTRR